MNILILGNGFDLAHDLPTSYLDMFRFFKALNALYAWRGGPNRFEDFRFHNFPYTDKKYEFTFNYLKDAFEQKFENKKVLDGKNPIEEMHRLLKENVWFKYFKWLIDGNKMRGINWIDFESEICKIVKELDEEQKNLYVEFRNRNTQGKRSSQLMRFIYFLDMYPRNNGSMKEHAKTYRDALDKMYKHLRDFVRCIEIYLVQVVEKTSVRLISPDIGALSPDRILSFNYTHTYENSYGSYTQHINQNIHHLHGETKDVGENNMVLGVDEFYLDERKNTCTNYNIFKKFTQRILYETGFQYRGWICTLKHANPTRVNIYNDPSKIYIFGHSLDVTDCDVLEEFFRLPHVQIIIYYYDKQQQVQQIANLVKMLGHDDFIEYINSSPAKIVFQKQAEMKDVFNA